MLVCFCLQSGRSFISKVALLRPVGGHIRGCSVGRHDLQRENWGLVFPNNCWFRRALGKTWKVPHASEWEHVWNVTEVRACSGACDGEGQRVRLSRGWVEDEADPQLCLQCSRKLRSQSAREDQCGLVRLKTRSQTMTEEVYRSSGDESERDIATEGSQELESHIDT